MSDELVFYTNPMSRGRIVRWMLEEVGPALPDRAPRLRQHDEGARVPRHQSDGQGAGAPSRRHGRHRVRRDLRLSRRRVPRRPAWHRRHADRARRPITAGCSSPPGRSRPRGPTRRWASRPAGPRADGRLRQPRDGDGRAGGRACRGTPYLAGDSFTAADVYVGSQLGLGMQFGTIEKRPAFVDYVGRLTARPAAIRAKQIDDALTPATAAAPS